MYATCVLATHHDMSLLHGTIKKNVKKLYSQFGWLQFAVEKDDLHFFTQKNTNKTLF